MNNSKRGYSIISLRWFVTPHANNYRISQFRLKFQVAMAVDTPAKIAVLGAGPIGLEAALYARFLGYEVEIFEEQPHPAGKVRFYAQHKMLTPFGMNRSTLGLAALKAQDEHYQPPADDAYLTYGQWYEQYLLPLAQTDLLVDGLRFNTKVLKIGKVELTKTDQPTGEYDRGCYDFRLYYERENEKRGHSSLADVVLDCGGNQRRNWLGNGFVITPGEWEAVQFEEAFLFHTNQEFDFNLFRGKSVLVAGDHVQAAWAIVNLYEVVKQHPNTRVTWVTRHAAEHYPHGPVEFSEHDPLPQRKQILQTANTLATSGKITWWPETWIESLQVNNQQVQISFSGSREETQTFDQILNYNGYFPEHHLAQELVLECCPRCDAPRPFADALWSRKSSLDVEYPAKSPEALITSEPNYYILGEKSFGRLPGFLFQHGLQQIRDVFTIIGDRASLDLYAKYR
jgi:thioredoxin reductase